MCDWLYVATTPPDAVPDVSSSETMEALIFDYRYLPRASLHKYHGAHEEISTKNHTDCSEH